MDKNTISELENTQNATEISLIPLFNILIRNRWIIISSLFIGMVVGLVITYARYKPQYEAEGSMLLQTPEKVKQDSSPTQTKYTQSDIVQSSYDTVVNSRNFIQNLILMDYSYTSSDGKPLKTNLEVFYNSKDSDSLIKSVGAQIKANLDRKTFVLKLSYISKSPEISAQVVNNAIAQLNDFYQNEFSSTSKRNLEFVKSQLLEAKTSLDAARKKLTVFIKTNKELKENKEAASETYSYQEARTELKNLEDDVVIKEKFYNSLLTRSQSLGIDASQTAPSIIILQKAFPPAKPLPRGMLKSGIMGAFVMLVLALIIVVLRNMSELAGKNENVLTITISEMKKDLAKIGLFRK